MCIRDRPMGSSDDLINDLIAYYVYIENCLVKKNAIESIQKTVIEDLKKTNGPPHTKVPVNEKFLKTHYNLSEVEFDEIHDVLSDTKVLWMNLRNLTLA